MLAERLVIAGPCGAESKQQVLATAEGLAECGVKHFRAGVWKPRTSPGTFEGVGEQGLEWLVEVRRRFGMQIGTEIANAEHARIAKESCLDFVWIGARTTTNPFAVQEVADSLVELDYKPMVLVKNPVVADLRLWIGAIDRLLRAEIESVVAVHRGFSSPDPIYRNAPIWHIPLEFRRQRPEVPLLCDPSHISGVASLVERVMLKSIKLGFDGYLAEVHYSPTSALSDSKQQVTPAEFGEMLGRLSGQSPDPSANDELNIFREKIDEYDRLLITTIAARMQLSSEIGEYKKARNIQVFQPERYALLMKRCEEIALRHNLSPELARKIMELIHEESVERQLSV